MRKLLVSILVIAACVFGASAAAGHKARDEQGNCGYVNYGDDNNPWVYEDTCKWVFEEASHTLTITGTEMGYNFYYYNIPWGHLVDDIHIVVIEEGITAISNYAFRNCKNLYSISIPSTVLSFGDYAFDGCSSLPSVYVPADAYYISATTFSGSSSPCSNLSSIYVEPSSKYYTAQDDVLYRRTEEGLYLVFCPLAKNGTVVIPEGVISMGQGAFKGCEKITSVSIPSTLTEVSVEAFEGCTGLTSVEIAEGVKYIYYLAFKDCTNLVSVSIPESVTKIDSGTFANCNHLGHIKLPSHLTEIAYGAFVNCNLTSISIPATTTYIGDNAFQGNAYLDSIEVDANNTAYKSVDGVLYDFDVTRLIRYPTGKVGGYEIPETVRSFDFDSFLGCVGLTSVTIPSGVTSLSGAMFGNCVNLESVTIPETVTSLGSGAFDGCKKLKSVTIPSGVTEIASDTFRNCQSLASVTIPSGVTYIGQRVFEGCSSLTKVTIPSKVTTIENDVFYHCGKLESIEVESGNPSFSSDEAGVLFNHDKTELLQYPGGKKGSYKVPDTVQEIKYNAFRTCSGLESVVLPSSITKLPNFFFAECSSLSAVTLPSALTEIGEFVFEDCDSLTSITIPGLVSSIQPNAFSSAKNFAEFIVDPENKHYKAEGGVLYDYEEKHLMLYPRGKASNYEIPEGVEFIDDEAFSGCSGLESITIPPSVTSIGTWAFLKCTGLASINGGSGVIEIGEGAFSECSSLTMLTIPPSVTKIQPYAFSGCANLLHVVIPSSVTVVNKSAFAECRKLISVIYEGKKDPAVISDLYEYPFRGCSALEFVCLPEDYESSFFCAKSTICKSGQCMELRSHINQCYRVTTDAVVEMRPNASRWERQTDGCFEYHCYNDTGRHSWSLCNSTNETSANMVCSGEEKCKAGDDAALGREGYPVDIAVTATNTNDFNMSHVVEVFSGITKAAGVKVATGSNKQGKVVRVVALLQNQQQAEELEETATGCAMLHFGSDESESNETECVGILRHVTSAKRLPKIDSSAALSNLGDLTIQLFTEGASNVHGKAFSIVTLMLVAVLVFMHNEH